MQRNTAVFTKQHNLYLGINEMLYSNNLSWKASNSLLYFENFFPL